MFCEGVSFLIEVFVGRLFSLLYLKSLCVFCVNLRGERQFLVFFYYSILIFYRVFGLKVCRGVQSLRLWNWIWERAGWLVRQSYVTFFSSFNYLSFGIFFEAVFRVRCFFILLLFFSFVFLVCFLSLFVLFFYSVLCRVVIFFCLDLVFLDYGMFFRVFCCIRCIW